MKAISPEMVFVASYSGKTGTLSGLLFTIVRRKAVDFLRQRGRVQFEDPQQSNFDKADPVAEANGARAEIWGRIKITLTPAQFRALYLRYRDRLSIAEVAEREWVTGKTVKSRLKEARKKLRNSQIISHFRTFSNAKKQGTVPPKEVGRDGPLKAVALIKSEMGTGISRVRADQPSTCDGPNNGSASRRGVALVKRPGGYNLLLRRRQNIAGYLDPERLREGVGGYPLMDDPRTCEKNWPAAKLRYSAFRCRSGGPSVGICLTRSITEAGPNEEKMKRDKCRAEIERRQAGRQYRYAAKRAAALNAIKQGCSRLFYGPGLSQALRRLKNWFVVNVVPIVILTMSTCLIHAQSNDTVLDGNNTKTTFSSLDNSDNLEGSNGSSESIYPDLRQDKELFKKFLQNPYPVKRVVFVMPGAEVLQSNQQLEGDIVLEGSYQRNTFFCRILDHTSTSSTGLILTKGVVSGKSKSDNSWKIDASAASGEGGSIDVTVDPMNFAGKSEAEHNAAMAIDRLRMACWFGMPRLVPESVRWEGDHFRALFLSDQWPQSTNTYAVEGEIIFRADNLPRITKLSSPLWRSNRVDHTEIHYTYDHDLKENRFYPRDFQLYAVLNDGRRFAGTARRILEIDFGDLPGNPNFKPSDFLPSNATQPPNLFVTTNGTPYWMRDGQLVEIGLPKSQNGIPLWRITWVLLVLSAIIIPVAIKIRTTGTQQINSNSRKK